MPDRRHVLDRLATKFVVGDGCWDWTAGRFSNGYGSFSLNGAAVPAHRVLYELLVGPIPAGLHIDHLCRNRGCVRPDHLEPVTCKENLMRGTGVAPTNAAKTHCLRGHEFTGIDTLGRRTCRPCAVERQRRYRAAR